MKQLEQLETQPMSFAAPDAACERSQASDEVPVQSGLSLRLNFSWTLVGNVVYAGCQWGMLVVLARMGTPEMVGQFALGLAITAPVMMLASLHLRAVQATDARGEYPFGHYLALRLLTASVAVAGIGVFAAVSPYRTETALVIAAVGVAKGLEAISDVFYGLLQQHEQMDRIAVSMMIKGPLSLAALGTAVYLTGSVLWGSVALAGAWALVLVTYDLKSGGLILSRLTRAGDPPDQQNAKAHMRPRFEFKPLGRLALLSLPLGLVMMLISLNANIPRYFVERYLGERELGLFAAMAYLMVAGTTVVAALGQASSPRLAKHYAAGDADSFRNLLVRLSVLVGLIGFLGVAAAIWAGKPILTLVYGAEYARQAGVLVWLSVVSALAFVQWILGAGMTAARYFRVQVPLLAASTLITAAGCVWLIPACGLTGAAVALLLGSAALTLGALGVNIHALSRIASRSREVAP